jgi:exonuclease III
MKMNSNTLKNFTITSHNICGFNSSSCRTELAMFLAKTQPAVLVLQEPKMDPATPAPPIKHYHGVHFSHPSKHTGIIMYIHHSVSYKILSHISHTSPYRPDETSTVVGFVWLSCPILPCPIVVGGVYLSHATTENDITSLARSTSLASAPLPSSPPLSSPLPVFLIGDFNSRHPHWDGDVPTRPAPQSLNKWVYHHLISSTAHNIKLTLVNNMFSESRKRYTHINTSHYMESVIDLAMTTHPSLVEGMYVSHEQYTQSDHFPITLTLRSTTDNTSTEPTGARTRWRTDASEEKWAEFKQHMEDPLSKWTSSYRVFNTPTTQRMAQQQLDDCWQQLNSIITTSATETIGTKIIPANHKEWWDRDPALPQLHRDVCAARPRVNLLRKRHKRFPNSASTSILLTHARSTLTTAKRKFRNMERECRIQSLNELAGSLDDGRHKLLWAMWKKVHTRRCPTTVTTTCSQQLGAAFGKNIVHLTHGIRYITRMYHAGRTRA